MSKRVVLAGLACVLSVFLHLHATAQVLFQNNFDLMPDFTVLQGVNESSRCYTGCSLGGWTAYNSARTNCGPGITGRPGYNNFYVNGVAGYPVGSEACRGGTGKCWNKWQEACLTPPQFDDADANFGVDLGQEYEDLYFRFYIRFPTTFTSPAGNMFKLWHVQHYDGGDRNPWNYFGRDPLNQPVASGGIARYDSALFLYAGLRCQNAYYCNGDVMWPIGTTTTAYQRSGIFDGQWHSIEFRFKRNSQVGVNDAMIEVWKDGRKLNYVQGYAGNALAMNDTGSPELRGWRFVSIGGNNMSWTDACLDGSGPMSECERWYAIDDVVISTAYIGPDGLPSPPAGVRVTPP
jgi:hypothetical protein